MLHTRPQDYLYINQIMAKQTATFVGGRAGGFGASPVNRNNVHQKIQEYDEYELTLSWYGAPADHAFVIFAAANAGTAPKVFADGLRSYVEFGLYTNTLYDNVGWGPSNYYLVLRHETGHVFWACDEYYQSSDNTGCLSCIACYSDGPRFSVGNPNCDNPNATGTCASTHPGCMMKDMTSSLCAASAQQVGW